MGVQGVVTRNFLQAHNIENDISIHTLDFELG